MQPHRIDLGERVVKHLANQSAVLVAKRTRYRLQRMKDLLSGDDSGLRSTWDEVCAQVQGDQSFYGEEYEDTVDSVILSELRRLPELELYALWLQTDEAADWQDKAGHQSGVADGPVDDENCDGEPGADSNSPAIPLCMDDIIPHVSERVYSLAADWSNRRIRRFLRDDEDY